MEAKEEGEGRGKGGGSGTQKQRGCGASVEEGDGGSVQTRGFVFPPTQKRPTERRVNIIYVRMNWNDSFSLSCSLWDGHTRGRKKGREKEDIHMWESQ